MSIKRRIAKLEQGSGGNTPLVIVNTPKPGESWDQANARFDREVAANPSALAIRVQFMRGQNDDVTD